MMAFRFPLIIVFIAIALVSQVSGGTWTVNEFLYKPEVGARGTTEKSKLDAGMDRIDARLGKEIWVGDPKYGTTLQEAITAIGANSVILHVPAGTYNVSANLTIPANITLKPERGAILSIPTAKTLTINGGFEAGLYQIFSCTGTGKVVVGEIQYVFSEWWGSDATAFQAACTTGKTVVLLNKTYSISPTISTACTVEGVGPASYIAGNITLAANGITLTKLRCQRILSPTLALDSITIKNCLVDQLSLGSAGQHAIYFSYPCGNLEITGCEVRNSLGTGIVVFGDTRDPRNDALVENIRIDNNYIHHNLQNGINIGNNKDVGDADTVLYKKVSINGNRIISNGVTTANHGIYVHSLGYFTINNNVITNMTGDFISLGHSQTNANSIAVNGAISGNSCYGSGRYGIVVSGGCKSVAITGNSIGDCVFNGIYFAGGPTWPNMGITIVGNTIEKWGANGAITIPAGHSDIIISGNTMDTITAGNLYGVCILADASNPASITNLSIDHNNIRNCRGFYMQGASGKEVTMDGLSFRGNKVYTPASLYGFHLDPTHMTIGNVIVSDNYFQQGTNTLRFTPIGRFTNVTMHNNLAKTTAGTYRLNDYAFGKATNYGTVAAGAMDSTVETSYTAAVGDKLWYTDAAAGGKIGKVITSVGPTVWKNFGAIDAP